jgi:peptide/nickel transport system substrate-binding protein
VFVRGTVLMAVGALAMGLAGACGGDDRPRGSITIAQSAQPDFLDPALSYTINGWEPMWLVYTPLLTYRRAEGEAGTELIPGLADDLPEISVDGKRYRLRLREGLEYSDGTPVKASDFERTIQRVLNLESGGSSLYLGIVGAREYVAGRRPDAEIPGIGTDNRSGEITIRLEAPDGTFPYALAANFAGLVPGRTPFRNLTTEPPPGVGPYEITRSVPNREFVMQRNERFDVPGIPPGKVDRITTRIVTSVARQADDVIEGRLDYMLDPPPADMLPEIRSEHSDRFREFPTMTTLYFFMNTRVAPFDDRRVRRAVNFALDERALARLFGGLVEPACNFLPPNVPGSEEPDPCPYGDPLEEPDVERARRLVKRAGARGEEVGVWSASQEPGPAIAAYYVEALNDIGLEAEQKLVDFAVYPQTVGNQGTKAQTGFQSWGGDYPHPAAFLRQFTGSVITETANINPGNVDDPQMNAEFARLTGEADLQAVAEEWAELDRLLVERAYVAVYGHVKRTTFLSDRMDFEDCSRVHPIYQNDYSSFCLK